LVKLLLAGNVSTKNSQIVILFK